MSAKFRPQSEDVLVCYVVLVVCLILELICSFRLTTRSLNHVYFYCLPMWGNCPMTCQYAIDKTLRRCARFVLNVNDAELPRNVFNITNICSLLLYILISKRSTVFKSINLNKIDDFSSFKQCTRKYLREQQGPPRVTKLRHLLYVENVTIIVFY